MSSYGNRVMFFIRLSRFLTILLDSVVSTVSYSVPAFEVDFELSGGFLKAHPPYD